MEAPDRAVCTIGVSTVAEVTLSAVEEAFETRLTGFVVSGSDALRLIPRVELPQATPRMLAHLGYWVESPSTARARRPGRERVRQRVNDTITVVVLNRIKPNNQRPDRRAAYEVERKIRERLTDPAWSNPLSFRVRHNGAQRGLIAPGNAEWFSTRLSFTVTRDASLGGS